MARVDLQPALVLHRRAYRETSALLEAFTRDHGRVGLVARGARRPRSPLRAVLQPFQPLLLAWSGRGDLATLRGAEIDQPAPVLQGVAVLSGLYLNELLMKLTQRHDPHPELFDAYQLAIRGLAEPGCLESTLRVFEKRLLQALGYAMVLDQDVDTGAPIEPSLRYFYHPEQGPSVRGSGLGGVPVSGRTLLALRAGTALDDSSQREAKILMRRLIEAQLGGRSLASRALLRPVGTGPGGTARLADQY